MMECHMSESFHFDPNLHQVRSKSNNLKVFVNKKTKGPKQNNQSRLRLRKETFCFSINYII
jgi:hypothetical protein